MITPSKSFIAIALALFVGALCAASEADARKVSRPNVKAGKIAHNVKKINRARVVTRNVRRAGRWVNGVWVVGGVASSVAVGTASNCGYYWRKWKETGSSYWRERYYENCR